MNEGWWNVYEMRRMRGGEMFEMRREEYFRRRILLKYVFYMKRLC